MAAMTGKTTIKAGMSMIEAELQEFKEEIDKKFKISKCKNFVFPRKTDVQKNHEHKSVHVYN